MKSCKNCDVLPQSQNIPCYNWWFRVAHILPKSRFLVLEKPKSTFCFFLSKAYPSPGVLRSGICKNSRRGICIWKKNKGHFLVFPTPPTFVGNAYFSTLSWLLNYTVAIIWLQTYESFTFLKSLWCVSFKLFLEGAPFFKRNVTFRCLNQNKRLLTIFSGQWLISW